MKKLAIMVALSLLAFAMPALAEQKLINITEDTIPDDSYRPVAGKEFLVAVKLVDVDVSNQEQPISNEPILFQASIGTLSETEVTTNIYGEAITWLTTSATADTSHSITANVKDKPEITPIIIAVKNIALPQDAPTAEELVSEADVNADKIQDIKADIQLTSDTPWDGPTKQLRIWEKGDKQKVEEISPNAGVFIRPESPPNTNPSTTQKIIVAFNQMRNIYAIKYIQENQQSRYPFDLDYIDRDKAIIIRAESFIQEDEALTRSVTEDANFVLIDNIWVFQKETQKMYYGVGKLQYTTEYVYANIQINTGIPDSEFSQ